MVRFMESQFGECHLIYTDAECCFWPLAAGKCGDIMVIIPFALSSLEPKGSFKTVNQVKNTWWHGWWILTASAAVLFSPRPPLPQLLFSLPTLLPTSSPSIPPLPLLLNWSLVLHETWDSLSASRTQLRWGLKTVSRVLQAGEGSGMWPPTLTLDLLLLVSLSLGAHGEQMSYRPQNCTLECIRRVRLHILTFSFLYQHVRNQWGCFYQFRKALMLDSQDNIKKIQNNVNIIVDTRFFFFGIKTMKVVFSYLKKKTIKCFYNVLQKTTTKILFNATIVYIQKYIYIYLVKHISKNRMIRWLYIRITVRHCPSNLQVLQFLVI